MNAAPVNLLDRERLVREVLQAARVLDVGAGSRRLAEHVVTTDIVARPNVDVVADVCAGLPFFDEQFDLVVCTSVLEHVHDERKAMAEIHRVTRQGGRVWIEVPFLYHFHISSAGDTADYRRWTWEGCKQLINETGLTLLAYGHNVGPGTALRLMAAEVLAMPFHHPKHEAVYYLVRNLLGWILYPLGMLDRWCANKEIGRRATGGFWMLAERP